MEGHSVSGESRKNGWVEQKKELTKVLKIAWPAVFESFFISLAGMIDVYMVSGLGSEAVASVGLTTQPKFLGLSLFFAMNVAIAAIVARRTGEKDKRRANETLAEAMLHREGQETPKSRCIPTPYPASSILLEIIF